MIIGIDIKLEPVPMSTTGSGEMFKFRLKHGNTFLFETDNLTTVSTTDNGTFNYQQFFPVNSDKIMTVSEVGTNFKEVIFKIPVNRIRYIMCYYE